VERTALLLAGLLLAPQAVRTASAQDQFWWLEDVESEKSLDWVRARNKESLAKFENDPRFAALQKEASDVLEATDRIPYPERLGDRLYNFWQDKTHVRGIWRRTTLQDYRKTDTAWETVLDVDALGKFENKSWVYKNSNCLPPHYLRCMIELSDGGKDASVWREFDTRTKSFVAKGFVVPEAKSDVSWLDDNTLLVGTDFGPGSLTESGYPRIIKRWRRGTELSKAPTVFEAKVKDVGAWPWVSHRPEGRTVLLARGLTFWKTRYWVLSDSGERLRVPLPESASVKGVFKDRIVAILRNPWKDYPAGAVVAMDLRDARAGKAEPRTTLVYELDEDSGFPQRGAVAFTKNNVLLSVMTDVKTTIKRASFSPGGGAVVESLPVPAEGTAWVSDASPHTDEFFFGYTGFLTPTTLFHLDAGAAEPERLKSLPPRFDASRVDVQQFFAVSKDGEHVPYFLIGQKGMPFDGSNPVLLHGYGGFETPQRPFYLSTTGKMWLERGGVYVLANIRGGGEYGPKWHQAALKGNRQKSFDDFISIAEDLIYQKITTPRRLGIMGASNGGLLVSAVATQRPDLFNAVVSKVPLTDMLRYHKLLAGASWMGEYGNPDDPGERDFLRKYSPYHNVLWFKERRYPEMFFLTSTKDDRVHPAHARKMVAKMLARNHQVWYFERIEGGHGGAADRKQAAHRKALEYAYLLQYLKD
jgi:prolyl oligopeptidase